MRVHGPRVTTVRMLTKFGTTQVDLAAIRPKATPENASVCRTNARKIGPSLALRENDLSTRRAGSRQGTLPYSAVVRLAV